MPFAKYEVDFVREHFAAVPAGVRPSAIALYFALVDLSANLLLDGRLSTSTLHACADECGLEGSRKSDRFRARSTRVLVEIGLLSEDGAGTYRLTKWHDHHRSRAEVQADRKAAAERKRRSRQQTTLDMSPRTSRRDVTPSVTPGHERDLARAHARRRASTEAKDLETEPDRKDLTHPHTKDVDVAPEVEPVVRASTPSRVMPKEVLRGI